MCMRLKIGIGDEHHRYYKYTQFRQNLRGDPTISQWFDMEWPCSNNVISYNVRNSVLYVWHLHEPKRTVGDEKKTLIVWFEQLKEL